MSVYIDGPVSPAFRSVKIIDSSSVADIIMNDDSDTLKAGLANIPEGIN